MQEEKLGLLLYLNGNCKRKKCTRLTRTSELSLLREHHCQSCRVFYNCRFLCSNYSSTWRGDSTGAKRCLRALRRWQGSSGRPEIKQHLLEVTVALDRGARSSLQLALILRQPFLSFEKNNKEAEKVYRGKSWHFPERWWHQ